MPPRPREFRNVTIAPVIGDKSDDIFSFADSPVTQVIEVVNGNGPEWLVTLEICSESELILVEGNECWTSNELDLEGRRSRGKRDGTVKARLTFTKDGDGEEVAIVIKVKARRRVDAQSNPPVAPKEIGHIRYKIWLQ